MSSFSFEQDEVLRSRNEASEKALLREKDIERSLRLAQEVASRSSHTFIVSSGTFCRQRGLAGATAPPCRIDEPALPCLTHHFSGRHGRTSLVTRAASRRTNWPARRLRRSSKQRRRRWTGRRTSSRSATTI